MKRGGGAYWFLGGLAASLLLASAAHAEIPPINAEDRAASPEALAADNKAAGFPLWLSGFKAKMLAKGLPAPILDATLDGLSYNPRVVAMDRAQPDDARLQGRKPSFASYLERQISRARVSQGRRLAQSLAPMPQDMAARYNVDPAEVLAIWGIETSYGNAPGNFNLFRSLASLAYDGRRAALFAEELEAAIRIVAEGYAPQGRLVGSWAGATGQAQFMPSSYLQFAVDGDGDGQRDIWSSRADILGSIAHYLSAHGWRGTGWGFAVHVPDTLDRASVKALTVDRSCAALTKHSRWLTLDTWRSLGLIARDGDWPAAGAQLATLVEPDGPGNGGYLTYGNFRAILAYNCSNYYALSVGTLADALARRDVAPDDERLRDQQSGEMGISGKQ